MSIGLGIGVQRPKQLRSIYSVNGKVPGFTADFIRNKYPGHSSLSSAITHARAGNATMTDGYGPELVTNGGFDSDSDWTLGTGWSIADGRSHRSNAGSVTYLSQSVSFTAGKVYEVSYNLTREDGGTTIQFVGGTSVNGVFQNSSGRKTEFIKAESGNITFRIQGSSTFVGSIDNVSVREMPVIKWAPHNLLTYSEDFSQWLKLSGGTGITPTVTDNFTSSPFGENTAARVQLDISGGTATSDVSAIKVNIANTTSETRAIWMRLNTGTSADITFELGSASGVVTVTNEWALYSVSLNGASFDIGLRGNLNTADSVDLLVWGAHLYRSDLGGMVDNPDRGDSYVPTTSSDKYLPRVGHHVYNGSAWVNEGLLAESEDRVNTLSYSHNFSQWTTSNASVSSGVTGPDGQSSAYTLSEGTSTTSHYIKLISADTSATWTGSVYIKKKDAGRYVQLRPLGIGSAARGDFDPEDGSLLRSGGGNLVDTFSEDVGNGWYRVGISCDVSLSNAGGDGFVIVITDGTEGDLPSYTGTDLGVYIYGAQLESGSTPSSLIPNYGTASGVTRAAETFTIPSANLPWPTPQYIGSELVTNGTFDTDLSGWTAGSSWSWVSGKAYDGDTQSGTHAELAQLISVTSGKVYAISFDISGLSGGNPTVSWAGSNLVQITADGSYEEYVVATASNHTLQFSGQNAIYYVDNVSVREINPLSISIGMEGRVTYADTDLSSEAFFFQWFAGGTRYIRYKLDTSGIRQGQIDFLQRESTSGLDLVDTINAYLQPDILVPYNIAGRHGSTFINGATDGVALTADTTPTVLPDLSTIDLNLAYDYMGTISEFRVWDRDLGDDGIVEATNPSLEPSLSLTFEGTGTNSFVVNNWSE